jgi:hypothetical protein
VETFLGLPQQPRHTPGKRPGSNPSLITHHQPQRCPKQASVPNPHVARCAPWHTAHVCSGTWLDNHQLCQMSPWLLFFLSRTLTQHRHYPQAHLSSCSRTWLSHSPAPDRASHPATANPGRLERLPASAAAVLALALVDRVLVPEARLAARTGTVTPCFRPLPKWAAQGFVTSPPPSAAWCNMYVRTS